MRARRTIKKISKAAADAHGMHTSRHCRHAAMLVVREAQRFGV